MCFALALIYHPAIVPSRAVAGRSGEGDITNCRHRYSGAEACKAGSKKTCHAGYFFSSSAF